jgi:hypothetical protein
MAADRPITPEQATLAAKAAGLDLDRPLSEQLKRHRNGDLEQRVADLSERVETLSEALGVQRESAPVTEQHVSRTILDGINQMQAKSPWMSLGQITQKGEGHDAA